MWRRGRPSTVGAFGAAANDGRHTVQRGFEGDEATCRGGQGIRDRHYKKFTPPGPEPNSDRGSFVVIVRTLLIHSYSWLLLINMPL